MWWLGGMAVMLLAVRPAVLAQLQGLARVQMLHAVLKRFFVGVWASVIVILVTGVHLYGMGASAAAQAKRVIVAAGGTASGALLPLGWNVMLGVGLLIMLIYAHIYFAGFKKLSRAVQAADVPAAAGALARMHPLILANLGLGLLAVAAVKLLR